MDIGLSMVATTVGQIVAMYQIESLTITRFTYPRVDSDRVDASEYAYSRLNTSDGPLMLDQLQHQRMVSING